jgi:hypothetical protein
MQKTSKNAKSQGLFNFPKIFAVKPNNELGLTENN